MLSPALPLNCCTFACIWVVGPCCKLSNRSGLYLWPHSPRTAQRTRVFVACRLVRRSPPWCAWCQSAWYKPDRGATKAASRGAAASIRLTRLTARKSSAAAQTQPAVDELGMLSGKELRPDEVRFTNPSIRTIEEAEGPSIQASHPPSTSGLTTLTGAS